MKTYPVLFLSLLLQWFPGAALGAEAVKERAAATEARVGVMSSASRMVFEGNETFSAERLYQGLHTHGDWLLAAHPEAPLADYVKATQAALVRGYQRAGFPLVKVTQTRWLADPQRLLCVIEEGPRYTAGEVTVTGAQSLPAAQIMEKLTTAEKMAVDELIKEVKSGAASGSPLAVSTVTKAGGLTIKTKTGPTDKTDSKDIPWEAGKPAALDPTRVRELQDQVVKMYAKAGHMQAKVEVGTVRDDIARTAALQVKILSEGPPAVLDGITCTGLKRDTEGALLKYLGLEKGRPFKSGQVKEIEDLLLSSARYTSYKVTATPRQADHAEMDLKLELVEMPEAPKLGEPLNASHDTLLKARDWFNDLMRTGSEDLLVTIAIEPTTGQAEELSLIYNTQHGLLVTLVVYDDAAGRKNPRRCTLRYAPDEMTVFFSAHDGAARQWLRQPLARASNVSLFAIIDTDEPKDGRTRGNFNFGGSWKQKDASGLIDLVLTMKPAAALLHSLKFADEWSSKDGLLVMNAKGKEEGDGAFSIVIEEATGRVREIGDGKGSWDKERTVRSRFSLTTAKGAWDKAMQEQEAQTAGLVDSYEAGQGLASWAGWLTAGFLNAGIGKAAELKPEEIARRIAAAQDFGRRLGGTAPQFLSDLNSGEESFYVPNAPDKPVTALLSTTMIALLGVTIVDSLVSEGSWPWMLAREVYYNTTGRNEYTGRILQEIQQDPQLGPVGCYLAAALLDWTVPAAAGDFRRLALTKLTAADFRQDWGLLVQNCNARQRTAMAELLEKVRAGGQNAEVDLLRDVFGSAEAGTKIRFNPLLDAFLHELRSDPARPLATATAAAMDRLWDDALSGMLRERLTPKGGDGKAVDAARVAAVVGGSEISRKDLALALEARRQAFMAKPGASKLGFTAQKAKLEQEALKELIDKELLCVAFKSMGNSIKPEQLDADMSNFIAKKYGGSKERFFEAMKRADFTLEKFRALREQAIIVGTMRQKISGMAAPPTEQEITQQVELAQTGAAVEGQVKLHTLTIRKQSKEQDEAHQRKLVNELQVKLKEGQDFEVLARKNSADSRAEDGGARDWLNLSALSPVIVTALAAGMKPGDISEVLDVGSAWVIVKLDEERSQAMSVEELRKKAMALLRQKKSAEFLEAWINNVRGKIPVQIVPLPEPAK